MGNRAQVYNLRRGPYIDSPLHSIANYMLQQFGIIIQRTGAQRACCTGLLKKGSSGCWEVLWLRRSKVKFLIFFFRFLASRSRGCVFGQFAVNIALLL